MVLHISYIKIRCPYCNRLVGRNRYAFHLRKKHPDIDLLKGYAAFEEKSRNAEIDYLNSHSLKEEE